MLHGSCLVQCDDAAGTCNKIHAEKCLFVCTVCQVVALAEALRGLPVKSLALSYNELGNTAAEALAQLMLVSADSLGPDEDLGLRGLDVSSNKITAEGIGVLADALAQPGCTLQVRASTSKGSIGSLATIHVALQTGDPMHAWLALLLASGIKLVAA